MNRKFGISITEFRVGPTRSQKRENLAWISFPVSSWVSCTTVSIVTYNMGDSTPPLKNTPPTKAHPGVYIYLLFFYRHFITRGYVEYHTPFGCTPKNIPGYQTPKYTPGDTIHPQHARNGRWIRVSASIKSNKIVFSFFV